MFSLPFLIKMLSLSLKQKQKLYRFLFQVGKEGIAAGAGKGLLGSGESKCPSCYCGGAAYSGNLEKSPGVWRTIEGIRPTLLADEAMGLQVRLGNIQCYMQAKDKVGIRCVQDLAPASFCQWFSVDDADDCRVMQMDTNPWVTA